MPMAVIMFFNIPEVEEKPAGNLFKAVKLGIYFKILILELILAGIRIITVTEFNYSTTGSAQSVIQVIVYTILGTIKCRPIKSVISIMLCLSITLTSIPINEACAQGEERESIREVDFTRPPELDMMNGVDYQKKPTLREPKKYYEEEQIGGEANTYIAEDNTAEPVDNTLVEKELLSMPTNFENAANDYTVKMPLKITAGNGVKLYKDDYTMELIPLGGDYSRPVAVDNAVLYNDVYPGIDYQYTVLGDTIKEDIVLNRPTDKHTFRFEVKANNLTVISIVAPEMMDASGEASTNLSLALAKEDGKYIATITADKEWLNAPERAYPVRIDPTIDISNENVMLYIVSAGYPDTYEGANGYPCSYCQAAIVTTL